MLCVLILELLWDIFYLNTFGFKSQCGTKQIKSSNISSKIYFFEKCTISKSRCELLSINRSFGYVTRF